MSDLNIPMSQLPSGHFISFEGLDGSGKSTQIQLLKDYLIQKGFSVTIVREPGGCSISEQIRHVLLQKTNVAMAPNTELLLYNAARSQLIHEVILPALQQGHFVLADRFGWSTYAYQGYGHQIPLQSIEKLMSFVCGNIWPEHSFLLDIPTEQMNERLKAKEKDRIENFNKDFFNRVTKGYHQLVKSNTHCFTQLNGIDTIDNVHQQVCKIISQNII